MTFGVVGSSSKMKWMTAENEKIKRKKEGKKERKKEKERRKKRKKKKNWENEKSRGKFTQEIKARKESRILKYKA